MSNIHNEHFVENAVDQSYVSEEQDLSPKQAEILYNINIKTSIRIKNIFLIQLRNS